MTVEVTLSEQIISALRGMEAGGITVLPENVDGAVPDFALLGHKGEVRGRSGHHKPRRPLIDDEPLMRGGALAEVNFPASPKSPQAGNRRIEQA